jgi:HlyD family secretion protein
VKVILELTDPPAARRGLGHRFRVIAAIVVWRAGQVLQMPLGALFRRGGDWAAFKAENGVARLTKLRIGHVNSDHAEVLQGLNPGDTIIVHPGDLVEDGVKIVLRP